MGAAGPRFLIVAGEASGDLHGAALVRQLRRDLPGATFAGLAGDNMKAEGVDSEFDSRDIAVVGFTAVPGVVPRAYKIFRRLIESARSNPPAAAILIDSPGFNLRLAGRLKKLGVPVIYYVSPQVWAWRPKRVVKIAARVDLMLVLFPFEASFYRQHEMPVVHVGHPLIDEVPELPQIWDQPRSEDELRLALLPGSRKVEVEALLPAMLDAAARLGRSRGAKARLFRAPTIERSWLERRIAKVGGAPNVELIESGRFAALADSHVGLCASGTATLELGLIGTPMLVVYKVGPLTERISRWLVHLEHFSLVNLVLGEGAVPELVQAEVEGSNLERRVLELVDDREALDRMRQSLARLRPALGERGASRRAAKAVIELIGSRNGRSGNSGDGKRSTARIDPGEIR